MCSSRTLMKHNLISDKLFYNLHIQYCSMYEEVQLCYQCKPMCSALDFSNHHLYNRAWSAIGSCFVWLQLEQHNFHQDFFLTSPELLHALNVRSCIDSSEFVDHRPCFALETAIAICNSICSNLAFKFT